MKSLDLNYMGVQELNTQEMQETDGGLVALLIVGGILLLAASCTININTQIGGQDNQINNTQKIDSAYNGNRLNIPIDVPIGY